MGQPADRLTIKTPDEQEQAPQGTTISLDALREALTEEVVEELEHAYRKKRDLVRTRIKQLEHRLKATGR